MRILLLIALLASLSHAADYALPSANQGNWTPGTDVGVDGGIDQYLAGGINDRAVSGTVLDVTQSPYNADDTGVSDVKAAVASAVSDASPGDVIYFPAGTYLFATGFVYTGYKDDITFRGAGVGTTTLELSTSHPIFLLNDPGTINANAETVTGTKTKGTSNLQVASSSSFSVGNIVRVRYENEVDNTRIQAGAPPVWNSQGFAQLRKMTAIVTAIPDGTHVTIDPPLPADATNLALDIVNSPSPSSYSEGVGFEDFSVTFDSGDHPSWFLQMNDSQQCWVYNVDFEDWSRNTAAGSPIKVDDSYKCEFRKIRFTAEAGSSSDGAIESVASTSMLIVDNILDGPWDICFYDSGNACNNVIAYNFTDQTGSATKAILFHNAHPSLNLIEGNVISYVQSDGYHGSASNSNIYRNWLRAPSGVSINRFNRQHVVAGNVMGEDGVSDGQMSWGNPNIGNGSAEGFAGPTGLSDQEGETDYHQLGYGFNEYVILAGDISAGDFWADWEITATLDTRTSDTEGIFSVSGGQWYTGNSATGGSRLYPIAWWSNKSDFASVGEVDNVDGTDITISFTSGSALPAATTEVQLYMNAAGWQERDLDVEASSSVDHNYLADSGGTGSVDNSTVDTLPASFAYASKPDWFYSLTWPPIDPDSPDFDVEGIPAGYRYTNGSDPPASAPSGTRATANTVRIGN